MEKSKISLWFIISICPLAFIPAQAQDPLRQALHIAQHGVKIQSTRLKVGSENIANEDSLKYQRKIIYVTNRYKRKLGTKVLEIKKYDVDKKSPFKKVYNPYHPEADPITGLVTLSNVDKDKELADVTEAQLSYEANNAIIKVTENLINKTIDLLK